MRGGAVSSARARGVVSCGRQAAGRESGHVGAQAPRGRHVDAAAPLVACHLNSDLSEGGICSHGSRAENNPVNRESFQKCLWHDRGSVQCAGGSAGIGGIRWAGSRSKRRARWVAGSCSRAPQARLCHQVRSSFCWESPAFQRCFPEGSSPGSAESPGSQQLEENSRALGRT